jgi:hypothetical protein
MRLYAAIIRVQHIAEARGCTCAEMINLPHEIINGAS